MHRLVDSEVQRRIRSIIIRSLRQLDRTLFIRNGNSRVVVAAMDDLQSFQVWGRIADSRRAFDRIAAWLHTIPRETYLE